MIGEPFTPETEYLRHRQWLDDQVRDASHRVRFANKVARLAEPDSANDGQGDETLPTWQLFASYADDIDLGGLRVLRMASTIAERLAESVAESGLTVIPTFGTWKGSVEPGVQVIVQGSHVIADKVGQVLSRLGCRYLHVVADGETRHVDTWQESISLAFNVGARVAS